MAEKRNPYGKSSNPIDIATGVERLVDQTRAELDSFKAEQNELRMRIQEILEENHNRIKPNTLPTYEFQHNEQQMEQHKNLSDEALKNAQKQIQILMKEKEELIEMNECAQRTIQNNEQELANYRNEFFKPLDANELKKKYNDAIQVMEHKINQQKVEINEQSKVIKMLYEHKRRYMEKVNNLQDKLNEKPNKATSNGVDHEHHHHNECIAKINDMEKQVGNYSIQLKEYERALSNTQEMLGKSINREAVAMHKVNESLMLAETAVSEKHEAEKRANTFEEECAQLAANIGNIMDRAAEKVEIEVADLKRKLQEKERILDETQKQIDLQLEQHRLYSQKMEARYNRIEHRYKDILTQNTKLSEEVKITGNKLHELELKLEQSDVDSYEERMLELQKQFETRLQVYIDSNRILKAKYKSAVDELTKEFEIVIYRLKEENSNLKSDIALLQNSMADCQQNESPKAEQA